MALTRAKVLNLTMSIFAACYCPSPSTKDISVLTNFYVFLCTEKVNYGWIMQYPLKGSSAEASHRES